MLYCPKCNQTYEEGVQRFCTNDGNRLLFSAASSDGQPKSIFTNVLNRTPANRERSKTFIEMPVLVNPGQNPSKNSNLSNAADFSEEERNSTFEKEGQAFEPEIKLPPAKPLARLIKPGEVPVSQARLGDRAVNPAGRTALSWENPEVLIGQTVKGRYVIVEQLGEDETGFVYLANDKIADGKKVIVRILLAEDTADTSSKILAEERVSLSHVNHPNIAHLFDSGELLEGFPFIVTEFVAGHSLEENLHATEQFNAARVARLIKQTANAISEAHRNGILHRNLKPENILLGITEASTEQVKVTDFGVFDGFEEQSAENLAYLSPEQLEGKSPTFASDIYSLAVIAFQMLTGRLPFSFSTEKELLKAQKEGLSLRPTNLRLDTPPLADEILEKALAFDPAERFPKARDFGDALFNALTTVAPQKESAAEVETETKEENFSSSLKSFSIPKPNKEIFETEIKPLVTEPKTSVIVEKTAAATTAENKVETVKATDDLAWEKRSPEPVKPINPYRIGTIVLS
ncbi:MAG: serine/threonine protein kinase, partial [Pyrinomonadaceae bacterium]